MPLGGASAKTASMKDPVSKITSSGFTPIKRSQSTLLGAKQYYAAPGSEGLPICML